MKKLKRIAVGQFGELQKISQKEQRTYVGGYGGDGNCFFNCLEYLNNKYGCHEGWTYEDYANDYVNGNGNPNDQWGGTNNLDDGKDSGPAFVNWEENKLNNEPFSYLSNCFDTEGSQWTLTGSRIAEFFNSDPNGSDNSTVVGTYLWGNTENGGTHCVIFTDYDESSGIFSYFDPTTGSTGSINRSSVICGAKVNGCK